MLKKDYRKLYLLQDKVLLALKPVLSSFYLTGGTALGRFYLHHRYSEDLDFFVNQDHDFREKVKVCDAILVNNFHVLAEQTVVYDDFVRIMLEEDDQRMKVEFVNDVQHHSGSLNVYTYGWIDSPLNILSNKLSAIVGRDEPKDLFDILTISINYQFHWVSVFNEAKKKVLINELDVEQRIKSFPVELLQQQDWHLQFPGLGEIQAAIDTIANDFILGHENSLGHQKPKLEDAKVES